MSETRTIDGHSPRIKPLFTFFLGALMMWYLYPLIARSQAPEVISHAPVEHIALTPSGNDRISKPSTKTQSHETRATSSPSAYESGGVRAIKPSTSPYKPSGDAILDRIATCESSGNLRAKNQKSSATGKYQFLKGSWEYYGTKAWGTLEGRDIFSEKDQDELALWVVSKNGYRDWNASKYCWG